MPIRCNLLRNALLRRYALTPLSISSGGRTRTCDLWVMSPTSCHLLHPAMGNSYVFPGGIEPPASSVSWRRAEPLRHGNKQRKQTSGAGGNRTRVFGTLVTPDYSRSRCLTSPPTGTGSLRASTREASCIALASRLALAFLRVRRPSAVVLCSTVRLRGHGYGSYLRSDAAKAASKGNLACCVFAPVRTGRSCCVAFSSLRIETCTAP